MKKYLFSFTAIFALFVVGFMCTNCRSIKRSTDSQPVTHEIWDKLLHQHVKKDGFVDYKGFIKDSAQLNQYLKVISGAHPNDKNWTREEQMAYWINAYNAFTVQLVIRHYPVKSIKDIKNGIPFVNTVWDIKFIRIEGYTYDLNNIEHNILRPVFKDARIHAAVNCASYSCPALRAEAYAAKRLNEQLDDSMRSFLQDNLRNQITDKKAAVSEIFKWFKGDFERDAGSVRKFINRHLSAPIGEKVEITHIDYDWRLNDLQ